MDEPFGRTPAWLVMLMTLPPPGCRDERSAVSAAEVSSQGAIRLTPPGRYREPRRTWSYPLARTPPACCAVAAHDLRWPNAGPRRARRRRDRAAFAREGQRPRS